MCAHESGISKVHLTCLELTDWPRCQWGTAHVSVARLTAFQTMGHGLPATHNGRIFSPWRHGRWVPWVNFSSGTLSLLGPLNWGDCTAAEVTVQPHSSLSFILTTESSPKDNLGFLFFYPKIAWRRHAAEYSRHLHYFSSMILQAVFYIYFLEKQQQNNLGFLGKQLCIG